MHTQVTPRNSGNCFLAKLMCKMLPHLHSKAKPFNLLAFHPTCSEVRPNVEKTDVSLYITEDNFSAAINNNSEESQDFWLAV